MLSQERKEIRTQIVETAKEITLIQCGKHTFPRHAEAKIEIARLRRKYATLEKKFSKTK